MEDDSDSDSDSDNEQLEKTIKACIQRQINAKQARSEDRIIELCRNTHSQIGIKDVKKGLTVLVKKGVLHSSNKGGRTVYNFKKQVNIT